MILLWIMIVLEIRVLKTGSGESVSRDLTLTRTLPRILVRSLRSVTFLSGFASSRRRRRSRHFFHVCAHDCAEVTGGPLAEAAGGPQSAGGIHRNLGSTKQVNIV